MKIFFHAYPLTMHEKNILMSLFYKKYIIKGYNESLEFRMPFKD